MHFYVVKDGEIIKEINNPADAQLGENVLSFDGDDEELDISHLVVNGGVVQRLLKPKHGKESEQALGNINDA